MNKWIPLSFAFLSVRFIPQAVPQPSSCFLDPRLRTPQLDNMTSGGLECLVSIFMTGAFHKARVALRRKLWPIDLTLRPCRLTNWLGRVPSCIGPVLPSLPKVEIIQVMNLGVCTGSRGLPRALQVSRWAGRTREAGIVCWTEWFVDLGFKHRIPVHG